ncbi:hypothetical protein T492DRAFT_891577 [Pavlovales sp. CCMP2436]|nr:hypothetical protein T492DRAFT_891577 [Pavlovales sp. CCMP2436]|mmetsp:Transcript_1871/g.4666  ORF Transcript_1871/g.4666 Transcript_1871/m.4666 type:complete len:163 (+) Transcript_1871:167-655(+)
MSGTTGTLPKQPEALEAGAPASPEPALRQGNQRLRWLSADVANTGSTARDHLANERTFLAWLRTGLSLLGVGLAFAKFAGGWTGMLSGGLFVSLGAVFIAFSGWRYFEVRFDLAADRFSINTGGVLVMLGLTAIVALGSTIVMVALLVSDVEPVLGSKTLVR